VRRVLGANTSRAPNLAPRRFGAKRRNFGVSFDTRKPLGAEIRALDGELRCLGRAGAFSSSASRGMSPNPVSEKDVVDGWQRER
jgi:hypothetical protein